VRMTDREGQQGHESEVISENLRQQARNVQRTRENDKFIFPNMEQVYCEVIWLLLLFSTTHCNLKAYCEILIRRSNFRHQASPRVSPRESTQRRKVELWAGNVW